MDFLKLRAVLGLDSSEYEKGLGDAKSKASSIGGAIGNGLKTAAKIGGAAIATATAAVGAFAASSVKTGADFDKSMSQVAATMGFTTTQLNATETQLASMSAEERNAAIVAQESFGQLRDYAQEMGRTTAFSASQASEALNYMALAGYDVETSMTMLPNVLNLAAAGSMDLATASDMVTDAQSALGLNIEETSQMVDQMAKTSSKTNTSVSQLGEAMLTIGATARGVKGGTVELSTVLGILADNGIKGAEGGTHLRNAILSLQTPTKDGVAALAELGMTYDDMYDSAGNLRSLPEIFQQMSTAMADMDQQSKDTIISGVFNKTDLAAVNALIGTNAERWDEVTAAIEDSKGAAQAMADTQLDNLAGDVTLFQSALEGAKIAVSDGLTPSLRKFVQFGTSGLSQITDAFQKDGLSGAMEAFGDVLADGINMIIDMAPQAIDAGMKLLGAVGQGILNNLPAIIDAATQIVPMLGKGIIQALPALLDGAIQIVSQLGTFLIESIPTMIPAIIQLVTQLGVMLAENASALVNGVIALVTGIAVALIDNLPLLIDAIIQINIALSQAIIQNLPVLVSAVVQILMAIVNLIVQYGIQFVTAVANTLTNIWNRAVAFGEQVLTFIITTFTNFVDKVNNGMRDMFNKVVEWLQQLPGQMAYYAGYAIGSFIKFFIELPGKVQEILTNTMNKVITFATNFVNKATEAAKNFLNAIVNGIKNLPTNVMNTLNNVITNVITFANNLRNKATDAARGFYDNLVNGVRSLPDRFHEIGSNIVQGIWNGISSGWDWLTSSVADLANQLLEGAKAALGIHSPSRVFAWVGRMVDEGFAKGIIDYAHLVDGALDDIINIPDVNAMVGDLTLNANADKSNTGFTQVNNIYSPTALSPYEVARQTRNATRDMVLAMNMGG